MQTNPTYTDGRSGIQNPILECLNYPGDGTTYQRYQYLGDSIDREAIEKEHMGPDGDPLGSDTREGFEKGAINLQLDSTLHSVARPGHIIHLDIGEGAEYFIAAKFGRARTRNDIVKGSLQVKKAINPVVTSLLTAAYGQGKRHTQAAGALAGAVLTTTVVNTRAGATLGYELKAAPGSAVPGWLSINAATGVIAGLAVVGSWEVDVVVTDTLAGFATRVGFGRLALIIA